MNKNRQKGSRNQQRPEDALSREEKKKLWVEGKVERAKSDDFNVISQKTRDTADTVNFLNMYDNLMYYIRMNAGTRGSKIPAGAVDKYIDAGNKIKDDLNLLVAEMCRDTGRDYRPPRGYKNPLLKEKAKSEEGKENSVQQKQPLKAVKKASEKTTSSPAPAEETKHAAALAEIFVTGTAVPATGTSAVVEAAA